MGSPPTWRALPRRGGGSAIDAGYSPAPYACRAPAPQFKCGPGCRRPRFNHRVTLMRWLPSVPRRTCLPLPAIVDPRCASNRCGRTSPFSLAPLAPFPSLVTTKAISTMITQPRTIKKLVRSATRRARHPARPTGRHGTRQDRIGNPEAPVAGFEPRAQVQGVQDVASRICNFCAVGFPRRGEDPSLVSPTANASGLTCRILREWQAAQPDDLKYREHRVEPAY